VTLPYDLAPWQAAYVALVLFGAAFVRGYSGFGFAALVIAGAGLVTNPLYFVPVVLICDAVMTLQQARNIWPDIAWRRVAGLSAGAFFGVPLGIWAVTQVGEDTARAAISVYVLAMCAILLSGWRLRRAPGDAAHAATGVVSGLANGIGVGGLPVAAFFSAQTIGAATFRATLIAYFTLMDIWTLPLMWRAGMIGRDALVASALAFPVLVLGIWLGGRHFLRADPQDFRRFAILLLAALAVLGLARSVVRL
jgi:uncharacterized protein